MRILLLTPPMTQVNTPYPATAYLTGFLKARGYSVAQSDPAIELVLSLLSPKGVQEIKDEIDRKFGAKRSVLSSSVKHFQKQFSRYQKTVACVIRFLQKKDPSLAHRIATTNFLPQGPRFRALLQWSEDPEEGLQTVFGAMGIQDRAQYLASLYVDDLVDVIRDGVDPRFEFSRYAEKLSASAPSFDPLLEALNGPPSLVDRHLDAITRRLVELHSPDVVGLTVPFPGNVYGAFRIAKQMKALHPKIRTILGGGYVNTELRELKDPRVFDFIDYMTLDDGEGPFLYLLQSFQGKRPKDELLRTFVRENGKVVVKNDPKLHDIPFRDSGTPTYEGLPLGEYLSMTEMVNPMHRLWSDGRWNKLTLAHGCYWKKCSFCDISLDYIGRYEDLGAEKIVDRIEALIQETGQTGFHFVDEAAPPKILIAMAKKIIERNLVITWWGNIRFEKSFTKEVTDLLAASGCVAVSGGLEVASDRLLNLMQKGVTVEQVARVAHAFTQSGVMVHAYLMYGFPTQTIQETVDSLERVRQLFAAGCLQSAYWHQFACTVHSPVGRNPKKYGVTLKPVASTFARNDIAFDDGTGIDHSAFYSGLKQSTYNYMHGLGFETDVRDWFEFPVPKPKVPKQWVRGVLSQKSELSSPA